MGINTEWKKIIKRNPHVFGNCWLDGIPSPHNITTVIDDFTLYLRSLAYGIQSWDDLAKRSQRRIQENTDTTLRRYVVAFDEGESVPSAKKPKQDQRDNASASKANPILPFSAEEESQIKVGEVPFIPSGIKVPTTQFFVERLMASRRKHFDIQGFITSELLSFKFPYESTKNSILVIDGGNMEHYKKHNDVYSKRVIISKDDIEEDFDAVTPSGQNHWVTKDFSVKAHPGKRRKNVVVNTERDDTFNEVEVSQSGGIGESDVKIPRHISEHGSGDVYVHSYDTDMICILLLNMKDWIDTTTLQVPFNVYLNLTADHGMPEILDVLKMWRSIMDYFRDNLKNVTCPIETIVMLMLLSSSDYVEGFPQIGPMTIWTTFFDCGHKILFPDDSTSGFIDEYGSFQSQELRVKCVNSDIICRDSKYRHAIMCVNSDIMCGDSKYRHTIMFDENKLYEFLVLMYQKRFYPQMAPSTPISRAMEHLRSKVEERQAELDAKNALDRTKRKKWRIPSDHKIYAIFRQIWWNMDYWMNGGKEYPFMDPTAIDPKSKLSRHGWTTNDSGGVKFAERVHIFKKI